MGEARILVVSHGKMAEGMVLAVRMVAGNTGFLDWVCLDENSDIRQFREELSRKLDEIKDADQILVLTDIQGGSPFTSSIGLLAEKGLTERSFVVSGMNLGLLLALALQKEIVSEEALEEMIRQSREGMKRFRYEEDDDEGL